MRAKNRIAFLVAKALGMLAAVEFDDQPSRMAGKVSDVRPDRHLPPEFVTDQPAIPKQMPKQLLVWGGGGAEPLCKAPCLRFHHFALRSRLPLLPLWEKVARSAG